MWQVIVYDKKSGRLQTLQFKDEDTADFVEEELNRRLPLQLVTLVVDQTDEATDERNP